MAGGELKCDGFDGIRGYDFSHGGECIPEGGIIIVGQIVVAFFDLVDFHYRGGSWR